MNSTLISIPQHPAIFPVEPNSFATPTFTAPKNRSKSFQVIFPFPWHQFQLKCRRNERSYLGFKQSFELCVSSSEEGNWIRVDPGSDHSFESKEGFIVVNFYHFVSIEDPEAEVAKHLSFMELRYKVTLHTLGLTVSQDTSFSGCYICGSQVAELRHRNCANLDCNLLFLCCTSCVNDLRGCCCLKCVSAPRLRPVLSGHQRYQKWHHYRNLELERI